MESLEWAHGQQEKQNTRALCIGGIRYMRSQTEGKLNGGIYELMLLAGPNLCFQFEAWAWMRAPVHINDSVPFCPRQHVRQGGCLADQ
jgi:hypothetical protein